MSDIEITDVQLLAYLDGQLEAEIVEIIEGTPAYQQRAAQLAQLQQTLTENLSGPAPSPLDLAQYQLGLLSPAETTAVANYLANHPHAARQLERLQAFWQQLEPPAVTPPSPLQTIKVWLAAQLSGGSDWQPTLAGVRGQADHIYQAGDMQIILDIDADPHKPHTQVLVGIVLNMSAQSAQAYLWSSAAVDQEWETAVDEDGTFVFNEIPSGNYNLVIRSETDEIHIESLAV